MVLRAQVLSQWSVTRNSLGTEEVADAASRQSAGYSPLWITWRCALHALPYTLELNVASLFQHSPRRSPRCAVAAARWSTQVCTLNQED